MPELPLFFCTRSNAATTLPRSTTRSISFASSVPERSSPWAAVGASPPPSTFGASPLSSSGSSSCLDFWRLASPRSTVDSLSSPFGPLRRQRLPRVGGCPARLRGPLLRPLLTSRSASQRRPFRREARSPQVRVLTFTAPWPGLRPSPLVARASRTLARSPWHRPPRTRFLFVHAPLPLLASFSLGLTACALLGVHATRFPRGLAPPCQAHAGHTKRPRPHPP
jgi:hypothetical protein